MKRYTVYTTTSPVPVGLGHTKAEAIADALQDLAGQGFIGPESKYPTQKAAREALLIADHEAEA